MLRRANRQLVNLFFKATLGKLWNTATRDIAALLVIACAVLSEPGFANAQENKSTAGESTTAGKSSLTWDHPCYAGPLGVTGSTSANALAAEADVVLAVGTRLQDFTTGSWSVFQEESLRLISLNVGRFDAAKHRAFPIVADARRGMEELGVALGDWQAAEPWMSRAQEEYRAWNAYLDEAAAPPGELADHLVADPQEHEEADDPNDLLPA